MTPKKKPKSKTIKLPLDNIKGYKVVGLLAFTGVVYEGKKYTVWLQPEESIEKVEFTEDS